MTPVPRSSQPSGDQAGAHSEVARQPWTVPQVQLLPRLTELTLLSVPMPSTADGSGSTVM